MVLESRNGIGKSGITTGNGKSERRLVEKGTEVARKKQEKSGQIFKQSQFYSLLGLLESRKTMKEVKENLKRFLLFDMKFRSTSCFSSL
jgi:hypothetical protein